jgi:hypothetical protein
VKENSGGPSGPPFDLAPVLEAAARGESVIPVTGDKRTWIKWKPFQETCASAGQVEEWAKDSRCAGFAVVTGAVSGLFALDFDGPKGIKLCERLGLAPHTQSPSGGYHVRFKHPGVPVRSTNSKTAKWLQERWPGLDPRGEGAYVIEWGRNGNGEYRQLRDLAKLETLDRLPEQLLADLGIAENGAAPAAATEPDPQRKVRPPGRHGHLLGIAGAMRSRGETEKAILAELRRINKRDCEPPKPDEDVVALAKDVADRYEPSEEREQLAKLCGLPEVGVDIGIPVMYGNGATASIDIPLSNGETMSFPSIREMVRPQALIAELVACAGATPELKQPQAVRIVKLTRALAEHVQVDSEDDLAREWGREFLQDAETIDFVLEDQAERFAAFERLDQRNPWDHARDLGHSFSKGCLVLADVTGVRLVRCEWFSRYVRSLSPRETPATVNSRMMRVGWERRGQEGRIKATAQGRAATLQWAFWLVPKGWGE